MRLPSLRHIDSPSGNQELRVVGELVLATGHHRYIRPDNTKDNETTQTQTGNICILEESVVSVCPCHVSCVYQCANNAVPLMVVELPVGLCIVTSV
jgi:hypothetical protein